MILYIAVISSGAFLIILYHHLTYHDVIVHGPHNLIYSLEVIGEEMLQFEVTLRWTPDTSPTVTNQIVDVTKGRPYEPEALLEKTVNTYKFRVNENTDVEVYVKTTNGSKEAAAKLNFTTPSYVEKAVINPPTGLSYMLEVVDV